MKKVLFLFALLAGTIGFVGCSDDDAPFEVAELEGDWYLVNAIEQIDGDKREESYEFNQPNNNQDCYKLNISKLSENRYQLIQYAWNSRWYKDWSEAITLDGRSFTLNAVWDNMKATISSLNKEYLVLEAKGKDEDGENVYMKQTFKKIN